MTEPECEWPWHKLNTRKDHRPFAGRSTLTFGESYKVVSKWPILQGLLGLKGSLAFRNKNVLLAVFHVFDYFQFPENDPPVGKEPV